LEGAKRIVDCPSIIVSFNGSGRDLPVYESAETRRSAPLRRHKEMPSASMVASQHPTLNDTILPMIPPASPVWIG